jgi:oligopeptide transport system substrate-binding protein
MLVTDGENNNTGWSNAEFDALIAAAEKEIDETKRLEILHRSEAILNAEMPIIPMYYYMSKNMVKPHVRGFYNNLLDLHPLYRLSIDREQQTPNPFLSN